MQKNEMRAALPGISVQRKDGTIAHYSNSEYIPFFYMIPKEVVEYFGKSFLDIPREPYALFNYKDIKAKIESDLFLDFISNVTEFMVWTFMDRGKSSYVYSGYEPAWIFSHSIAVWIKGFMDYNGLVSVKLLYQWCQARPEYTCSYVSLDKLDLALNNVVPKVMEQYNMKAILDVAKEYRCFEDYNCCDSDQKTDFFRKWYHNRTKHPQISLDGYMDEYKKNHNGQSWNPKDPNQNTEEEIISEVMIKQFMDSLSEKDRKILKMRLEGYTQEEIADELGYKNHSGVQKRITKIGLAYQEFTKVDLGFDEEN